MTLQPQQLLSRALVERLADFLFSLLPPGRPRRVARMYDPGGRDKYRDIPRNEALDHEKLLWPASGPETWATTLDLDGRSRAGVVEVDDGGRTALLALLAAAARLGLTCFAIPVDNPLSGHAGGHAWFVFDY